MISPASTGSYEAGAATGACRLCPIGYVDDDSDPVTPCTRCDGVAQFQSEQGQTQCFNISVCQPGFTQLASPSFVSDRVCVPCGAGRHAVNELSAPITLCTGFFKSEPGSAPCSAVTVCPSFEFVITLSNGINDTVWFAQALPCSTE